MKVLPRSLNQLPYLSRNRNVIEFSSYNRLGINYDHGNYLYKDSFGDAVIFEASGPGCIRSFWATGFQNATKLKIYFDDDENARYEINIVDLFSGKHKYFEEPLVSYECRGYYLGKDSMAGNCFVPISFSRNLKISVTGNEDFFYHFIYERYTTGAQVKTFPDFDLIAEMSLYFTDPEVIRKTQQKEEKTLITNLDVLPMNGSKDVFKCNVQAVITELTIEAPCASTFLKDVFICMRWDNMSHLHVQVPVGTFFSVPFEQENIETIPITVQKLEDDRIRLVSYWPMPFWKSCHIYLDNRSNLSIPDIKIVIKTVPQSYIEASCGYFTTLYRRGETEQGRDWLLYEGLGWGHLVGVIQTMNGEHYCEGDEHFYIDDACSPQINGTGSEDYYLGCFWPNTKYDSPFAGCVYDIHKQGGGLKENYYKFPAAYYRFHLEATIPFYRHVDARIQHGPNSNIQSKYSSLAFCYLKKKIVLYKCDYILVSSETSRRMHNYTSSVEGEIIELSSSYEGNYTDIVDVQQGYIYKNTKVQFYVSIHPENNGVKIRRRIDQKYSPQKLRVYVDNIFVGLWYDTNENPYLRWYDSDFEIPEELTINKSALILRLETIQDKDFRGFTAFSYTVFYYRF